jgi:hypothetical protein
LHFRRYSVPRSINRPFLFFVAAAALILACGPRAAHKDDADQKDASVRTAPSNDTALAVSTGVSVGSDVRFTMHVTNLHDRAMEIRFPTGQTHEFVVIDSAGREVWNSSNGRMFTQSLQNRLLATRETLSFGDSWDGAGHNGRFTAVSRLNSSNHPVEERVEFVLP